MRIAIRFAGLFLLAAAAASSVGAQTSPPEAPSAAPEAYVDPLLEATLRLRGAARAVIRLRPAEDSAAGSSGGGRFAAAAAAAEAALGGAGGAGGGMGPLGGDLRVAEITAAQVQALLDSGAVAAIHVDRLLPPAFDRRAPQTAPPAASLPDPLPESPSASSSGPAPASETRAAASEPPRAPEGPAVAIIDTGVAADHPYLRGLVVRQACFSSTVAADRAKTLCPNGRAAQTLGEAAKPCDPAALGALCGHGTKVAGIAAGRGGEIIGPDGLPRAIEGIAPGAPILAIQVFSRIEDPLTCASFGRQAPCPLSYVSDQIAALRFVSSVAAEHDVAVANLSLAGAAPEDPCDESFEGRQYLAEIAWLMDRVGVATVTATGNSGLRGQVGMPACVSRALAVTALDEASGALARFSNVSASADLAAPGVGLASSSLGAALYETDDGTSFAAAQTAGALLLLKRRAPALRMERLIEALLDAARPEGEGAPPAMDLAAALGRFDLAMMRAAPGSGLSAAASSGGPGPGSGARPAPLPPILTPQAAPRALPPDILAGLRPAAGRLSEEASDGLLHARLPPKAGTVALEVPIPLPVPAVAVSAPELRAGGARFLFEADPALLGGGAAGEAFLRRLILQAAPAESPVAELRLDPETGRGAVTFETRLDSRQAEAFAAGFPGRLAADRLAAP